MLSQFQSCFRQRPFSSKLSDHPLPGSPGLPRISSWTWKEGCFQEGRKEVPLKSGTGGQGAHKPSQFVRDADASLEGLHSLTLNMPAPHRCLPTAVQWSAGVVFLWQFWPSLQQDHSLLYVPLCTAREEPCYFAWLQDRLRKVGCQPASLMCVGLQPKARRLQQGF